MDVWYLHERRKTNEELKRLVGVEPIITVIRSGRLRWYGHVMMTGWRNIWSSELKAENRWKTNYKPIIYIYIYIFTHTYTFHTHISHTPVTPFIPRTTLIPSTSASLDIIIVTPTYSCPALTPTISPPSTTPTFPSPSHYLSILTSTQTTIHASQVSAST